MKFKIGMIPFSPPRIDQQTIDAVVEVLRSGWITTGPKTKEFERQLAEYIGVPKVIALNSWTNACELALRWFGVGEGDEVIVPAYTYCASANIIRHVGAKPVIVDVLQDFTVDPSAVAAAVTERTKCIIPVDVGGLPAHIDELLSVVEGSAGRFKATSAVQSLLGRPLLLSDAAHSFGATYKGAVLGRQADITGYSFHAVKNLTTAEGGALAFSAHLPVDHEAVYRWFNTMSLHGQTKDALAKSKAGAWRYDVVEPGFKCNMTDIQAAIGLVELARYNKDMLPRRKNICQQYSDGLSAHTWAEIPSFKDDTRESSYHLYMVRVRGASEGDRDTIIQKMAEKGVSANVHFQPLPMLSAYADHQTSSVPKAMELYANEISLPVYYDLTGAQVLTVINALVDSVHEVVG